MTVTVSSRLAAPSVYRSYFSECSRLLIKCKKLTEGDATDMASIRLSKVRVSLSSWLFAMLSSFIDGKPAVLVLRLPLLRVSAHISLDYSEEVHD